MDCFKVCIMILSVLISIAILITYQTLPNKKGEYVLNYPYGGEAHVHIEDNGIPHIIADNMLTASFALGYVHAADRLWQMEYMRRLSQGTMSEIFGQKGYELDEAFRTLGFKEY